MHVDQLTRFQFTIWFAYLIAAVVFPAYHVKPILKFLRGTSGIGDSCIRTEIVQCLWRVPALLFGLFVTPSVPFVLAIFLDIVGRMGRITAMRISQRRHERKISGEWQSSSA